MFIFFQGGEGDATKLEYNTIPANGMTDVHFLKWKTELSFKI